jgi:hypothetical protein
VSWFAYSLGRRNPTGAAVVVGIPFLADVELVAPLILLVR